MFFAGGIHTINALEWIAEFVLQTSYMKPDPVIGSIGALIYVLTGVSTFVVLLLNILIAAKIKIRHPS